MALSPGELFRLNVFLINSLASLGLDIFFFIFVALKCKQVPKEDNRINKVFYKKYRVPLLLALLVAIWNTVDFLYFYITYVLMDIEPALTFFTIIIDTGTDTVYIFLGSIITSVVNLGIAIFLHFIKEKHICNWKIKGLPTLIYLTTGCISTASTIYYYIDDLIWSSGSYGDALTTLIFQYMNSFSTWATWFALALFIWMFILIIQKDPNTRLAMGLLIAGSLTKILYQNLSALIWSWYPILAGPLPADVYYYFSGFTSLINYCVSTLCTLLIFLGYYKYFQLQEVPLLKRGFRKRWEDLDARNIS
ncbi:MAG: hypothetical protein ACFFCS_27305 [Candidatus Hodarchaeota archaeon]